MIDVYVLVLVFVFVYFVVLVNDTGNYYEKELGFFFPRCMPVSLTEK